MKTNYFPLKTFAAIIAFTTVITSCNRHKEKDKDIDTQAASDFEQGQFVGEDVSNMADAAADGIGKFRLAPGVSDDVMSGCATITLDTLNSTDADTITIDFGTSNCLCIDNRYRRGILTIIRFGNRFTAGSYRTVTFNNYFVNDHQVEGTHTITNNGQNSTGNWNWTVTAQNMKITKPNGKWHSWNSTRNREMIAGSATPLLKTDDVFIITGIADGTNLNGNSYAASITSPLKREGSCHWIVQGTVLLTPSNKPQRVLDYGNGSCDDQATVAINGNTYNITLH